MKECYLCDTVLSDQNRSKEHILLNAIGGTLKSSELLCKTCNSELGHKSDSELAKQFLFISSFLNVKRDSGEFPILKNLTAESGKKYHLTKGGIPILNSPSVKTVLEKDQVFLSVTARNEKEMMQILRQLKKKYPAINLETIKDKFINTEEYLNEYLTHSIVIGGDLALQSIVKTAVNYYILHQNEKSNVEHLFDYLKGKNETKIVNHFNSEEEFYNQDSEEIVHLIHLYGSKSSKLLYCYVEFFSAFSFLVLLNDNYNGEDLKSTYCYDILNGKEITKDFKVTLDKNQILEAIDKGANNEIFTSKLTRILKIGYERQSNVALRKILTRASDKILKEKYKEGEGLSEEVINEYVNEIVKNFMRFKYRNKKTAF